MLHFAISKIRIPPVIFNSYILINLVSKLAIGGACPLREISQKDNEF